MPRATRCSNMRHLSMTMLTSFWRHLTRLLVTRSQSTIPQNLSKQDVFYLQRNMDEVMKSTPKQNLYGLYGRH
ncbi:unnamed protein product [Ceutorhynchus assimilis]|uniref:Uncharacterized protein n=1 Tax=Ceutorhynchus assimilis TaxID=467358 RepID=A0A9N9QFN5_9CUCU|nr:unnamed protein product [Ceutorhynchus assimilis]